VDFLGERVALLLQAADLFRDVECGVVLHIAQLVDLRFQLSDGLLEIEKCLLHLCAPSVRVKRTLNESGRRINRSLRSRRWYPVDRCGPAPPQRRVPRIPPACYPSGGALLSNCGPSPGAPGSTPKKTRRARTRFRLAETDDGSAARSRGARYSAGRRPHS